MRGKNDDQLEAKATRALQVLVTSGQREVNTSPFLVVSFVSFARRDNSEYV